MNNEIIKQVSNNLGVRESQVLATLKLLEEGNTIPFIARYRKEVTGSLDEEQIRVIDEQYQYQVNLLKRKEDVIRLIDEKGMLTEELRNQILACQKLVDIEDLYRPYKEKKKTKATEAIANGLEPLAKMILAFNQNVMEEAKKFINEKVKTKEAAIEGAKYIIAEIISDNASYRKYIRDYSFNTCEIASKKKKNDKDELQVYSMYYDYKEPVKKIRPHRVLALNRGEKEGVLSVSINFNVDNAKNFIANKMRLKEDICSKLIQESIEDSLKRLILPSIEREIRSELTEQAEEVAIINFGKNLEKVLLQPPMKGKIVLGLDPAYRTGCKLAVIDETGKLLTIDVIYPHEPKNEYEKSKAKLIELINKYNVNLVAVGNGTASRESEALVADVINSIDKDVSYLMVNEAGASVYSASKLAIKEFPDLHVEQRSAVSIARRIEDPLSELVKIEPKSIGVGLYQHDVSPKRLDEILDFTVKKAVNSVGVNINTASEALLSYVSGLNKKSIDKIIDYRNKKGLIDTREEILKNKVLTEKAYEQAIGFLRIPNGSNPLDKTSIHPESYNIALELLNKAEVSLDEIGTEKLINKINKIDSDSITTMDIIDSLKMPNRDPRDMIEKPILRKDILKIENLEIGMKLQGTVRNVIDFGVFIDIGLKNDGLAHISQLSKEYIKHPSELFSVGDIVDCYVLDILNDKNKVQLTLLSND